MKYEIIYYKVQYQCLVACFVLKYPSCTARTEEYIWRSCDDR